jgi:uncharacterized protein YdhG (YjbR/CyaY superfamily)
MGTSQGKNDSGFSTEEKTAMKQAAYERKSRPTKTPQEDLEDCLAAIEGMSEPDKSLATRVHRLVTDANPDLQPRTWYGMPAYSLGGNTICFLQVGSKFKTRYATLGFSDKAKLDAGGFWPNAYALTELTPDIEGEITELVKRATR